MTLRLPVCVWCHELPADGGDDPIGDPWCVRCKESEMAVQAAARPR